MNRRGFLTTCASLLPLPAFVRAASLWLPPERPRILHGPHAEVVLLDEAPQDVAVVMELLYTRTGSDANWIRGCRVWEGPGFDWVDPEPERGEKLSRALINVAMDGSWSLRSGGPSATPANEPTKGEPK